MASALAKSASPYTERIASNNNRRDRHPGRHHPKSMLRAARRPLIEVLPGHADTLRGTAMPVEAQR